MLINRQWVKQEVLPEKLLTLLKSVYKIEHRIRIVEILEILTYDL